MTLELNKLYNMDCMEGMQQFPDNYFELAIVDPPYGIKINMNMGRRKGRRREHEEKRWDNAIPPQEYFNELTRVSKNQIIWGELLSTTAHKKLDILGQAGSRRCFVRRWRACMDIV